MPRNASHDLHGAEPADFFRDFIQRIASPDAAEIFVQPNTLLG